MIVSKLGTEDIAGIGAFGRIEATLPDKETFKSVQVLANKLNRTHPREDGLAITTKKSKVKDNTIVIEVVKPEDVNRKIKK